MSRYRLRTNPPGLGKIRLVEDRSTNPGGMVQATKPQFDVVVADDRLFSHAGVGLLAELADRLGLAWALDRFAVGTRLTPMPSG